MRKVLIAIDGSTTSKLALEFARDLLAGKETTTLIVHIIPQHVMYGRGGAAPVEVYDMHAERAAANGLLAESSQYLRDGGIGPSIETRLAVGDPADLILTTAEDSAADLIILGSRGLNAAQRFLMGSVSTKVAAHAHCAVLIVRPKAAAR
jgi:nucleotide-binding universal stress UspA family protein